MSLLSLYEKLIKDPSSEYGSFEEFFQSENLTIKFQNLKDFDFRNLTEMKRLKEIEFIRCEMKNILFDDIKSLEKINFRSCQMNNLELDGLDKIESLFVKDCKMKKFPSMTNCFSMLNLRLENIVFDTKDINNSKILTFKGGENGTTHGVKYSMGKLRSIEIINCNHYEEFNLSNMFNLGRLMLRRTSLKKINVLDPNHHVSLHELHASYNNELEELYVSPENSLRLLDLRNCKNIKNLKVPSNSCIEVFKAESLILSYDSDLINLFRRFDLDFYIDDDFLKDIMKKLFIINPVYYKGNKKEIEERSKEIIKINNEKERDFLIELIANNPVMSISEARSYYSYFNENYA